MQYTEFYQFRKPTKALDVVKVGDINYNSDLMDELIHSTQISLAPAYDETRTSEDPYNTGDVVMKDALMYKCKEDGIYGAWDATKWERTTAGEEGEARRQAMLRMLVERLHIEPRRNTRRELLELAKRYKKHKVLAYFRGVSWLR